MNNRAQPRRSVGTLALALALTLLGAKLLLLLLRALDGHSAPLGASRPC